MFTIITILNPLTGGETRKEYKWERGKSLAHYLEYEGKAVVTWEQVVIELPLAKIFPARKEVYTVLVIPEGMAAPILASIISGGSGILAPILASKWGRFALWVGANWLSNFLKDKEKDIDTSQSYSWRHISSPAAAFGSAMPIVYGKTRVRPTVKNRYVTVDGDIQTLYALYGVTGHLVDELSTIEAPRWSIAGEYAIDDIVRPTADADEKGKTYLCKRVNGGYDYRGRYTDAVHYSDTDYWEVGHGSASFNSDVYVNGQAIGGYNRDVKWETRPGLAQQIFIEGFDVTYTNYAQDESLYLDQAIVNRNEIKIVFNAQQDTLHWSRHTMFLAGTTYVIAGTEIGVPLLPNAVAYLIWRSSYSTTKYLTTLFPQPTDYIIASINTGTNKITHVAAEIDNLDWTTFSITFTNTHNIELLFELPYGLQSFNVSGGLTTNKCSLFAQYRKYTAGSTEKWNDFAYQFSSSLHIEDYANGTLLAGVLSRKTTKPLAVSVKALPDGEYLDPDNTYEIRVTAASSSHVRLINIATLIYGMEDADGSYDGFTYPGEALLGVKALASGQVNSDLDIQVDVERSKVWVWNPNLTADCKWQQVDANLHCWAVYDILVNGYYNASSNLIHPAYPEPNIERRTWTNSTGTYTNQAEAIYGCGINPARIDFDSFNEWGTYLWQTLDYELNIVFDTFMTAWDAILRICQEGRGMVYPIGSKIYAFTDKAEDVSQIFTMGSIHTDTFTQKYVESKQQVNLIEADFFNKDNNYEKTSITARTSDWDSSRDMSVPSKITLYGTDTFDQAQSIIQYMLMRAELLDNVVAFSVDIDSLASQVGEVVGIQHSVTDIGISCGGRVVSSTSAGANDAVVIDQEFTLEANVTYTMEVKHSDGTLETNNIIVQGVETTTANMGFTADWATLPPVYTTFTIFKTANALKKYRIIKISRTTELMRTLTLEQYDERVYESWAPGSPPVTTDPGEFTDPKVPVGGDPWSDALISILNLASNVRLREVVSMNKVSGEYESSVIVTWDTENGEPRGEWEVYFRDVDVSDIDWYGEWLLGDTYNYGNKVEHDGRTYISMVDDNVGSLPFYR